MTEGFDLFDEAMNAGPPTPLSARTADMAGIIGDEWGLEGGFDVEPSYDHRQYPSFAISHPVETSQTPEDPEAALPVTYGDDEAEKVARRLQAVLGSPQPSPQPVESPEERGRRLLAYVDASLQGAEIPGPNPFEHLMAGQADNELAAAAGNFLATRTALKTFSPIERKAIIDEGEDVKAGNLDRLDIAGTHYEMLEATGAKSEDEDLWMLDGDPNGMD